jgi:hypothetical protein
MARRLLLIALSSLAIAGAGWWLFGWHTQLLPNSGTVTYVQRWGRCTMLRFDLNGDGRLDREIEWPWSNPWVGIVDGPCGDLWWSAIREDDNRDGRWDTWVTRPDPSKPCVVLIRADTNGDGNADWEESSTPFDPGPYARLKALRGY